MTNRTDDLTSTAILWGVAALAGVVVAAIAIVAAGLGLIQGIFVGAVVAILVAVVMSMGFHGGHAAVRPTPEPAPRRVDPAPQPATAPQAVAPQAATPKAAPDVAPATTPETGVAQRPAALTAARGGKADDLKKIKGVGPKLEQLLNSLGFYHFDQIAGWSADELAWVDDNLTGFKGRATRDDWQAQAKVLAAGGETEFSTRVGKGQVY